MSDHTTTTDKQFTFFEEMAVLWFVDTLHSLSLQRFSILTG